METKEIDSPCPQQRTIDVTLESFVNIPIPDDLDITDTDAVDRYAQEHGVLEFRRRLLDTPKDMSVAWEEFDDQSRFFVEGEASTPDKELPLNRGQGTLRQWIRGRYVVNQYTGEFEGPHLRAKAETGLFYARASGSPHAVEGEGVTVDLAITDMKARAAERAASLVSIYQTR